MMGFPRWFKPIMQPKLASSWRAIGSFSRDQDLRERLEVCCVTFERRLGFLNWMFTNGSE